MTILDSLVFRRLTYRDHRTVLKDNQLILFIAIFHIVMYCFDSRVLVQRTSPNVANLKSYN
jgi:hypothetical protein